MVEKISGKKFSSVECRSKKHPLEFFIKFYSEIVDFPETKKFFVMSHPHPLEGAVLVPS